MKKSIHKGLKRFFEKEDGRKLPPEMIKRIRLILYALDVAIDIHDMDVPGWHLHPLKGDLLGFYAVTVRGNWRIIFRLENGNAFDVDFDDYH